MKKIFLFLFTLFAVFRLSAYTIDITDLGAIGDSITDNTIFIQQAIDECSQRSGTVIIPSGKYLTRTLFLKSNVHLHLHYGAELTGSVDLQSYHDAFPAQKKTENPALIFARNERNIAITGYGTINGQGQHANFQHGNDAKGGPKRPKIILFIGCQNVKIQDVTLRNSAYWTQDYQSCDGVMIKGVKVYSHANWNNDGLDIDSKNVIVSDCYIDCDDDAICFKSDTGEPCENVTVTNCVLRTNCNAIKFGTASCAGFKNITVSNCVILQASEDNIRQWYLNEPWLGTTGKTVISGIALESVDGGIMDGIIVSNISMKDVQTPIFIRLGDRKRTDTNQISILKNININNIIAESASKVACSITGIPDAKIENVFISNLQFNLSGNVKTADISHSVPEQIDRYPENRMFNTILPASGFYVRHAKNIYFNNIDIRTFEPDVRPMFYLDDTENIRIENSKINGNTY